MDTITLKIKYFGKIKLNGKEFVAPLEMTWFHDNDLTVDTGYEKIIFNTGTFSPTEDGDYEIMPSTPDKRLEIVSGANVKLAKNNIARYVIIDDKYAFRLPSIPNH